MTNALYITPPLPLKDKQHPSQPTDFEDSLLEYFSYYSPSRTGDLVSQLKRYDFSSVKAQFVGSVPGRFDVGGNVKWGLLRLGKVLKEIPASPKTEVFAQVPSPSLVHPPSPPCTIPHSPVHPPSPPCTTRHSPIPHFLSLSNRSLSLLPRGNSSPQSAPSAKQTPG